MSAFRKTLWWGLSGSILSLAFAAYSHAANVDLTWFFTEESELTAELSSADSLDFALPKGTKLGKMRGAEISEAESSLAEEYTLALRLGSAPTGSYTVTRPIEGETKDGLRIRLRKGTEVHYRLADAHELVYEIGIPENAPLEKLASTEPTEYALAADTDVIVRPPTNSMVTLTIPALAKVEMIPGGASLGTTLQVEQRRSPVNGYITLTIANEDFAFSKSRFEVGVRIQEHGSDNIMEPFAACDAVELIEVLPGRAKLKARIPELSILKGMFLAKPVDLLVIAHGPDNSIAEAVVRDFKVSSRQSATLWWVVAALVPWALAAFIVMRRSSRKGNGQDLDQHGRTGRAKWLDPIWFVSGKYGQASLSLAQILLWTFLVFSASFYVLIASGKLLDLTDDVLILLGITGGSSVIAKISAFVRTERGRDLSAVPVKDPKWQDLVQTEGRPDLYKFQMLMFTALAALFVVFEIAGTFEFPALPAGLLTLIGISNGVYLAAKATAPTLFEKLAEVDRTLQEATVRAQRCRIRAEERTDKQNTAEKEYKDVEGEL